MRVIGERGEILISLGARPGAEIGFRLGGIAWRFGLAPLAYARSPQAAQRSAAQQLCVPLAGPAANIAVGLACLACPAGGPIALFGWIQLAGGLLHLLVRNDGRRALAAYRAWREISR